MTTSRWLLPGLIVAGAIPAYLVGEVADRAVTVASQRGQGIGFMLAAYVAGLVVTKAVAWLIGRFMPAGDSDIGRLMPHVVSAALLGGAILLVLNGGRSRPGAFTTNDILAMVGVLVLTPQAVWAARDLLAAPVKRG